MKIQSLINILLKMLLKHGNEEVFIVGCDRCNTESPGDVISADRFPDDEEVSEKVVFIHRKNN